NPFQAVATGGGDDSRGDVVELAAALLGQVLEARPGAALARLDDGERGLERASPSGQAGRVEGWPRVVADDDAVADSDDVAGDGLAVGGGGGSGLDQAEGRFQGRADFRAAGGPDGRQAPSKAVPLGG